MGPGNHAADENGRYRLIVNAENTFSRSKDIIVVGMKVKAL